MTKRINPLVAFVTNAALDYLGLNERGRGMSTVPEIAEIPPIVNLQHKEGTVIPIVGAPEMGKSVLARRLAEIIGRPTFAVSPGEKPPNWIKLITLDDVLDAGKVPVYSTVILDDVLLYASSKDYNDPLVRQLEQIIPVARHERKLILLFCTQVSSLTDKYIFTGPMVILKLPSLLYEDVERQGVKKLQDRAAPYWEGKSEAWLQRHAYVISHTYEGLVKVNLPSRTPLLH